MRSEQRRHRKRLRKKNTMKNMVILVVFSPTSSGMPTMTKQTECIKTLTIEWTSEEKSEGMDSD